MLKIGHHWIRLQHSIDEFIVEAAKYLGEEYNADDCIHNMDMNFLEEGDDHSEFSDEQEDDPAPGENWPKTLLRPKIAVIPLSFNLEIDRCKKLDVAGLVIQEITLWKGQANDMLDAIKVHLGDKAVLFRITVQPAKLQATTT
ncbi:hypothetical protein F4604DRAFT_1936425 [Suillus subluteus]|nr:hypothetical protein F4604DRAFT_1936425 [Suillus subluteus]